MNNRNEISIELQEISKIVADLPKMNPFTVPSGYFDRAESDILEKTVFKTDFITLKKKSDQFVPQGYFESLSNNILAKIKRADEEATSSGFATLSPLLSGLKDKNVFSVPAHYFDNLSDNILSKVAPSNTGKVVTIGRRLWKYAAAAAITGIVATTTLWTLNKDTAEKQPEEIAITQPVINSSVAEAAKYKTEADITTEIANLPADEILSYLEKTATYEDIELLSGTINSKDLPEQTDYLLDEQVLDKYLQQIENNTKN